VGLDTAQFGWPGYQPAGSIPGDGPLQVIISFAEYGIVVLLTVLVALQRPWARPRQAGSGQTSPDQAADVLGKGLVAAILALLAAVIAAVFSSALTLTVTNLLGSLSPVPAAVGLHEQSFLFYVPPSAYAGGAGFLIAAAAAVFVLAGLLIRRQVLITRLRSHGRRGPIGTGVGTIRDDYARAGRSPAVPGGPAGDTDLDGAVTTVAKAWATSSLTDCAALVLAVITGLAALAMVADEALLSWWAPGPAGIRSAAAVGGSLSVVVIGLFIAQLRTALTSAAARKKFSFVWDVITFWPRACHPLAPPCYAERSVPELVTRIRRLTGDEVRDRATDPAWAQQETDRLGPQPQDAYASVLLSGYSQGAPICVAVMAQLPGTVRDQTALLTLAAPVRRLYGRAFPAWFGTGELARLRETLTRDGTPRWRNVIRRSDFIGGWVFGFPAPPGAAAAASDGDSDGETLGDGGRSGVDHVILDPPALWTSRDPSPPPIHKHSDWFPDPQTRPSAEDLISLLP
jgi:hypothetical protein